ncbi:MAG: VOC family protein [Anaeromyxobacter sp.]|nr:VOC family protein [Anaeromyxobacter sp.]
MFAGPQHGRAEEAMRAWAGIFPDSRLGDLERYAPGEGPEGTVKHGRFVLAGQDLVAMDSHLAHGLTFNEAVSLQVMCEDQATLDRVWDALATGGSLAPCGWLKRPLRRLLAGGADPPPGVADGGDAAARDRPSRRC